MARMGSCAIGHDGHSLLTFSNNLSSPKHAPPVPGHAPLVLIQRQRNILPLRHMHHRPALSLLRREPRGRLLLRARPEGERRGQGLCMCMWVSE